MHSIGESWTHNPPSKYAHTLDTHYITIITAFSNKVISTTIQLAEQSSDNILKPYECIHHKKYLTQGY